MFLFKIDLELAFCTAGRRITSSPIKASILLFLLIMQSEVTAQDSFKLQSTAADHLSISYIGNMGVLLASGGDAVLIDGLHRAYKPAYTYPSDTTVKQIIQGSYQHYGSIAMALVTHDHRDHFAPEHLLAFLRANPGSLVLAAAQASDKIRQKIQLNEARIRQQLQQIPYDDAAHPIQNGQVEVTAFKCPHVNARHATVQNLAFVINVNGHKILHVGDSNWDVAAIALQNAKLTVASIDIAILPYWMLLDKDSKEKVNQLIRPKKIIATHVPPELGSRERSLLHQYHNNIIVFDKLNQQIIYK